MNENEWKKIKENALGDKEQMEEAINIFSKKFKNYWKSFSKRNKAN